MVLAILVIIDKPLIKDVLLVKGLKHNLLSISQMCDTGYNVSFKHDACLIAYTNENIILKGIRRNNIYELYLENITEHCLIANNDTQNLWHMRMGHVNSKHMSKLAKSNLVRRLPKMSFKKDYFCDACQLGKLSKSSFKSKNIVSSKDL